MAPLAEMFCLETKLEAPPENREVFLGRTLPDLLQEVCDRYPNPRAFNQWTRKGWQSLSNQEFQKTAADLSQGLLRLGLRQGDRVAFLMHSGTPFCLADMGCLMAGLITVPIDLTQTIENIVFILHHSEAKALIVSDVALLTQVLPYLEHASALETVILVQGTVAEEVRSQLLIPFISLEELCIRGQACRDGTGASIFYPQIAPADLATILYIAGPSGRPRGVMLTHENISADILAAFASHPDLGRGDAETALIFLPLTHIFARAFLYGHLYYGHSVYFSTPSRVVQHLKDVRPTIVITVPRLLEKIYSKLLETQQRLKHFDRVTFRWALHLANQFQMGHLSRQYAVQHRLADRLVYARWRQVFGGRLKTLICGGAALREEINRIFLAAGIPVKQGYGLTETSAVLCYNRGQYQKPGTVGVPIAGVEVAIAPDHEILVKAPYVTCGYYKDPRSTREAIDERGWFHTGDLGEITDDGFLRITGVKKNLFKLSTGKYVTPIPLEHQLKQSPLVDQAVVVGANHKFCGVLIFPKLDVLRQQIQPMGQEQSDDDALLRHPCVLALYQTLVETANCHLPYWSTIRRFQLINAQLTLENGMLSENRQVNHTQFFAAFAQHIHALYGNDLDQKEELQAIAPNNFDLSACPVIPGVSCPPYAQSLTHY